VTAVAPNQAAPDAPRRLTAGCGRLLLLLLGPGLMVMLADTDAGSSPPRHSPERRGATNWCCRNCC